MLKSVLLGWAERASCAIMGRDGDAGSSMKKRRYVFCPVCRGTRMRRLGKSDEATESAQSAVDLYYGCPGCGLRRAYDIRRNAFVSRAGKRPSTGSH